MTGISEAPADPGTPAWGPVRDWILERNPDVTDLSPDTDILETRVVTSLQFVELVLFVEDLRGRMLEANDVDLDAFRTLESIERTYLLP
ncbi:acyl carrier protein [Streptomyces venezuelae]|uniref:acyl carrier protein n=1 Tax=Streptomyces venezuelae TaxID=54571 RepID=UPI00333086C5